MALGVYELTGGSYVAFSTGGSFSNPLTTVHNGRDGNTFELELYVKGDNANTYSNIQVLADSTTDDDDIGSGDLHGATGWGVKLMADPGHNPTEDEWAQINYGDPVNITGFTGSSTARPFWYRIESPPGIEITTKRNITLKLLYTEA